MGLGSSTTKSLVQCNVGNKSPVFLCALLPDKTESCHLDVEFEEDDEVIFSVIGPRSVHLTGYFLGSGRHSDPNDDTYPCVSFVNLLLIGHFFKTIFELSIKSNLA